MVANSDYYHVFSTNQCLGFWHKLGEKSLFSQSVSWLACHVFLPHEHQQIGHFLSMAVSLCFERINPLLS